MLYPNGTTTAPKVSSPYGPRSSVGISNFHAGTDYVGFIEVKAIAGGKVTRANYMNDAAGNTVAVDIANENGVVITVMYMHLASFAVRSGDTIAEGQTIGIMGKTGNATGVCAHIEIRFWKNGTYTTTDPVPWLAARVGGQAPAAVHVTVPRSIRDIQAIVGAKVDGIWGPETESKVRAFQTAHGLTADGIWGPKSDAAGFPVAHTGPLSYADIQRGLNKFGYGLAVDGVWGPKSHNALGDFQRKHGLTVDYLVGPKTRAALGI